jgi:small-conductance mechanosensitive channel/CRP-like cAMP-binding protein
MWTPYVVAAFIVVAYFARNLPPSDRPWLRIARNMLVAHLLMLLVVAGLVATEYDAYFADLAALAFETLCIVGLSTVLVFRLFLPRLGWHVPRILVDIITAIGVLVAFIAVGKRAGFSVAGLITTSAVLTAVIGFSLQDTLGNMMGGLALQMDNSVKIGDWISLGPGQPQGRVSEIRWRYTAIETREWETIIIPNGVLMKSQVVILGRRVGEIPRWRKQIDFFVDFRTPPTQVIEAVLGTLHADRPPRVAATPEVQCLFFGIRDSYAHFCVRYWTEELAADEPVDSEVRVRLYFALQRAGIKLSIPAQALFITQETDDRDKRKADDEAGRRMEAVDGVDVFRGLSDEVRRAVADQLAWAPFARGEAITREGDHDDGLYMIVDGSAAVQIGRGNGGQREVARLGAGQFFGEMSLMTGEARSATVVAASDLVCYRIDKPAFHRILRDHPEIADEVAGVLASRKVALDAAKGEAGDQKEQQLASAKQDLLGRIRGFFSLSN